MTARLNHNVRERYSSPRAVFISESECLEYHLFYFNYALLLGNKGCVPPSQRTSAIRIHIISLETANGYFRHSCDWRSIERGAQPLLVNITKFLRGTTKRAATRSVLIAVISPEFIHSARGRKRLEGVVFVIRQQSSTSPIILDPPRVPADLIRQGKL